MLPPFSALVAVEKACPPAGATPKQPIIGSSGRTRCSRPGTAGSSVAVSPCRSIRQFALSRGGRPRTNSGSTTLPASDARVQPVARIGVMRRISTLSASPGSAPVDEDRAVHRVRLGRALHAVLVDAVGVDGFGDHRIARGDGEGGRQGAQHIVPGGGDKAMRCHGRRRSPTSQWQQERQQPKALPFLDAGNGQSVRSAGTLPPFASSFCISPCGARPSAARPVPPSEPLRWMLREEERTSYSPRQNSVPGVLTGADAATGVGASDARATPLRGRSPKPDRHE